MRGPAKARFEAIFAEGARHGGPSLRLVVLPGTGLVGVATAKKLGGKPPRNRQKRRVKEAFRLAGGPLPDTDVVIVAGERAARRTFEELVAECADLRARCRVGP